MGRRPKVINSGECKPPLRPALSPEAKENQMISLAMDLVEERLRNGTASSQETTHFLKLASEKERTEQLMLKKQMEYMDVKMQSIQNQDKMEQLVKDALEAFRRYSGNE